MNIEQIREKLDNGQATVGSWLQLPNADVAELMAASGYDWIACDMEHGSFGPDRLPDIFRAIQCGGASPFARLPEADKVYTKTALEAGAEGLIFPMIESAAQLEKAIDLATYPGQDYWRENGRPADEYRGVGFCRANLFGKRFASYRRIIAARIFIVAQIEHIRAVENLDAILDVPRLDAIMVGPYDLSGSMGLTGEFDHPEFKKVMEKIAATCKKHIPLMGLHIVQPDPGALRREIANGCRFIAYGIDSVFLWQAAQKPDLGD